MEDKMNNPEKQFKIYNELIKKYGYKGAQNVINSVSSYMACISEKCKYIIEDKSITVHEEEKKKFYYISELEKFMTTQEYKAAFNGVVDKRNSLNDLTGKEWLPETKSYLYQRGLGADSPEAQIEKQHPAP